MDHPARRNHALCRFRGRWNCIITATGWNCIATATAATVVLCMVQPVHVHDGGLRLVRILSRLPLAAQTATPTTTATISFTVASTAPAAGPACAPAQLLRSSRGLLPRAAVLQNRRVGLLPPPGSPIRTVPLAATRRVRER